MAQAAVPLPSTRGWSGTTHRLSKPRRQMVRHDPQVVTTARPGAIGNCEPMQPCDQDLPDRDKEQLCGGCANFVTWALVFR